MDKRIMENRRVKEAIVTSFFSLLETVPFDMISITEITKNAKVSRMAYYRNFNAKIEIIQYFLDRSFEILQDRLNDNIDLWSLEYSKMFFGFMKEQKEPFLLLDRLGFSGMILNAFTEANEQLAGDMSHRSIHRYALYYAAGAAYNGMIHWLRSGTPESVDTIAKNALEFCGIPCQL